MWWNSKLFLVLCIFCVDYAKGQGDCLDVRGRSIAHGLHYVPGPDACTLCVCDNGLAKFCKAVLCSPPLDCRSFRLGNTCCEFICLDDVVRPPPTVGDTSFRVVVALIILLALLMGVALLVYRIRNFLDNRPNFSTEDQRSLTSIGYISGSVAYMNGTCETGLSSWKPPTNYMPRGEAPPPYEEAISQPRVEIRVANESTIHRCPVTLETLPRPEDSLQHVCNGPNYVSRHISQIANPAHCYNAPLLQPSHQIDSDPAAPLRHYTHSATAPSHACPLNSTRRS